jgi:serine/threonine protein kinase
MPKYFMHDPSFLQRFEREVRVIAKLQHPRIVPVYDYGQIEGQPYIVMAYMPGGTLTDKIKLGPMQLTEVVRLVDQIAEGLDHAHHEGVIHRDFKPSNVLLDKGTRTRRLRHYKIMIHRRPPAAAVSTPAYMALVASEASPPSTYALGVTVPDVTGVPVSGRYNR